MYKSNNNNNNNNKTDRLRSNLNRLNETCSHSFLIHVVYRPANIHRL